VVVNKSFQILVGPSKIATRFPAQFPLILLSTLLAIWRIFCQDGIWIYGVMKSNNAKGGANVFFFSFGGSSVDAAEMQPFLLARRTQDSGGFIGFSLEVCWASLPHRSKDGHLITIGRTLVYGLNHLCVPFMVGAPRCLISL
jgi:hypothetical protein